MVLEVNSAGSGRLRSSWFSGYRALVSAGLLVFVAGLVGAIVAWEQAQNAVSNVLNIRALLDSEQGIDPRDYTATWIWVAVGVVGLVLIVVGLVRRKSDRSAPGSPE